jgi:hypothetical protein
MCGTDEMASAGAAAAAAAATDKGTIPTKAEILKLPLAAWLLDPYVTENDQTDADICLAVLRARKIVTTAAVLAHSTIEAIDKFAESLGPPPPPPQASASASTTTASTTPASAPAASAAPTTAADAKAIATALVPPQSSKDVGYAYIWEVGTRNRLVAAIKEFHGFNPFPPETEATPPPPKTGPEIVYYDTITADKVVITASPGADVKILT